MFDAEGFFIFLGIGNWVFRGKLIRVLGGNWVFEMGKFQGIKKTGYSVRKISGIRRG